MKDVLAIVDFSKHAPITDMLDRLLQTIQHVKQYRMEKQMVSPIVLRKRIHSKAYHAAFTESIADGGSPEDAKLCGREAAQLRMAQFDISGN